MKSAVYHDVRCLCLQLDLVKEAQELRLTVGKLNPVMQANHSALVRPLFPMMELAPDALDL